MYRTCEKMYKMWDEMEAEVWRGGLEETRELLGTKLEGESPTSFFEGVAVAFPVCLFLWFLIYLGIRQIFF